MIPHFVVIPHQLSLWEPMIAWPALWPYYYTLLSGGMLFLIAHHITNMIDAFMLFCFGLLLVTWKAITVLHMHSPSITPKQPAQLVPIGGLVVTGNRSELAIVQSYCNKTVDYAVFRQFLNWQLLGGASVAVLVLQVITYILIDKWMESPSGFILASIFVVANGSPLWFPRILGSQFEIRNGVLTKNMSLLGLILLPLWKVVLRDAIIECRLEEHKVTINEKRRFAINLRELDSPLRFVAVLVGVGKGDESNAI